MNKMRDLLSKTLVVGVIVLFIGVAVQPAFADVSNTSVSDNDDGCNLCAKKVSKQHLTLIESLLNRLEKYDNQLLVLSKQYPEFEEKYQLVKEEISTLKELNGEGNFCNLLIIIIVLTLYPGNMLLNIGLIIIPTILLTICILAVVLYKIFCYEYENKYVK